MQDRGGPTVIEGRIIVLGFLINSIIFVILFPINVVIIIIIIIISSSMGGGGSAGATRTVPYRRR